MMLLIGLAVMMIFMTAVWIISRLIKNSGIVDVAWALGFPLVTTLYLLLTHAASERDLLLSGFVAVWSLRLGWHLFARFRRWYPEEDPRYSDFKKTLGDHAETKMLLVFMWQGAILTSLSAPIAVSIADPNKEILPVHIAALVLFAISIVGETMADWQLSGFTKKSENKGKTCQVGLWRYSRHPNYFFEWLVSVCLFLFALSSPYGAWTIICPLLLLHILVNLTGVKPSEEHSMKTRSDYAEYKARTSPFVPWFRRKET